jgi:hypothetical protein
VRLTLALSLLLATSTLVGCGDDTTAAAADLAAAADPSVSPDMTVLSCGRVLACVAGCGQNFVCQSSCRDAGSTAAKGSYDAFTGCVALSCASVDGGTAACTSATDTRPTCQTCLSNVATQAPNASAPCHSEYAACAGS